jgi:molecular chaperone GrpE
MTESETNDQPPADATSAKTASSPPPAGGQAPASAASGPAEGVVEFAEAELADAKVAPDALEAAKAEAAKYREQLLRTAADFDNFRKRARREQEEAQRRGTEKALKDLLPVFDNLERATQSAATAPDVKSVADGLAMIGRQFSNTLEKMGIKRIAAVGQAFDPSLHEAIQHVDSTEHPAGVIAVEVQAGYMLGDYLLRAALVAVSKGAPAPADTPAASAAGDAPPAGDPPAGDPPAEA